MADIIQKVSLNQPYKSNLLAILNYLIKLSLGLLIY